jgi:hypothetical protein
MRLTYVVVHEASASLEISERKQCFSSDSIWVCDNYMYMYDQIKV